MKTAEFYYFSDTDFTLVVTHHGEVRVVKVVSHSVPPSLKRTWEAA